MRRVVTRLAAFVPLTILVQAAMIPVPRYLMIALDQEQAASCCRPLGECCPAASSDPCASASDATSEVPSESSCASKNLPMVVCCILCHCGIGLVSPAPALPAPPALASLTFPPGPSLRSIDSERWAPPPKSSMSV